MQSIPYEQRAALPNIVAVYIVRSESECLYVGSSWTLRQRFASHTKQKEFAKHKACTIEYLPCSDEELATLEDQTARKYLPTLNKLTSRASKRPTPRKAKGQNVWAKEANESFNTIIAAFKSRYEGNPVSKTSAKISEDTGLGVHWLNALYYGQIPNPSYNKIRALAIYLGVANV